MNEKLRESLKPEENLSDISLLLDLKSSSVGIRFLENLAQVILTSVAENLQEGGIVKLESKRLEIEQTSEKTLSKVKYNLVVDQT